MRQLRGRDGQGRLLGRQAHPAAVIMSLIVIGEAATKVMDGYSSSPRRMPTCRGAACAICVMHGSRLFRHQPRCGVGDGTGRLPALLQQLPAVRQDADDEDVTTTVKEGSPMTVESRIFSVPSMFSRPKASLFVPLCLKPGLNYRGLACPSRAGNCGSHSPHGQDTWTVLSGMADYFQGKGLFVPSGKVR